MTEYGFQAYPDLRTIGAFTVPEDRRWDSAIMNAHQKNNRVNGNQKIRDYMRRDYPEPRDFASFVYLSQVMQARAVKVGAEHLRRNRPRTMGSIFWQLNDCWPVVSWASVDYYGRWKALQYYARRFYNDLLVSPHQEDGVVAVYVVSDSVAPVSASLRVRLMSFAGDTLSEKSQTIQIPALSSTVPLRIPMAELAGAKGYDPKNSFVVAELSAGGRLASQNVLYFAPPKDLQLPAPEISSELTKTADGYRLRLLAKAFAPDAFVSAGALDADYSDNFVNLLPGQPVDIAVKTAASLEQLRSALKIVSLGDAFAR
jgi:beta-mannosidase